MVIERERTRCSFLQTHTHINTHTHIHTNLHRNKQQQTYTETGQNTQKYTEDTQTPNCKYDHGGTASCTHTL